MKKSLLVLAIVSTLTACGGGEGSGGSISGSTYTNHGEIYFNDQGGSLNLSFTPAQLPTWIKNTNGTLSVDKAGCENRTAELSSSNGSALIVQTSTYSCNLSDYMTANSFLNYSNRLETPILDSSQRIFTNSILDSRLGRISGTDWPRKRGLEQLKFQLNPGDCRDKDCTRTDPRERNEIAFTFSKKPNVFWERPDPNKEYWVSFSFYVPKPYSEQGSQMGTNQEVTIFQIISTHETNGVRSYNPFLMVGKKFNGDFTSTTWVNDFLPKDRFIHSLIKDSDFEGHWHDVVIKYMASANDSKDPSLQIWINGIEKLKFYGRTLSSEQGEIYFKFGLYRPVSTSNPIQEIYFDEFRLGNSRMDVELK
jgi:hypothetical protein